MFERYITIVCDRCQENESTARRSFVDARLQAQKEGFVRLGGDDVCPDCLHKMNKMTEVPLET